MKGYGIEEPSVDNGEQLKMSELESPSKEKEEPVEIDLESVEQLRIKATITKGMI